MSGAHQSLRTKERVMNGSDRKLETMAGGGAFFESPRWHDGRLWVSDYWRHQVLAISPQGVAETVVEVPDSPSGLGWLPDGTLLVVSMLDRKLLRVENGTTTLHADLSAHSGPQGNDMVVDATGRAYVGTIDFEGFAELPTTNLLRVDPDGSVAVVAEGLSFPNGMVLTPDGSTLILAESWAQRLTAFDVRPDGSLGNRRAWAQLGPPQPAGTPGQPARWSCAPDGITLDAEGAVWVADAANKRAIRVREGGELLEEVHAGGLDVIACALGDGDGRTLFVCATPDFRLPPQEAARTRPARILTCRVDVPHAGRP
jgi:sugar lactone lactonase YvrE